MDISTVKYKTLKTSDSNTEVTLKGQACQNTISDDEGEDVGEENKWKVNPIQVKLKG